jgi:hypothetical protein
MIVINVGMTAATIFLVRAELNRMWRQYPPVVARFEDLYASSGSAWVFLAALASVCAYFVYTIYADYWGSKAIYTYLTLPVRREWIYVSRLLAFMLGLILLSAVQILCFRAGYAMYVHELGESYVMHNGLFLAFLRSPFMRLLVPVGWLNALGSISMLLALATGIYYVMLCERAGRRFCFLLGIGAGIFLFDLIQNMLSAHVREIDGCFILLDCVILLAASIWFVLHGLSLVRRGAIVV